MQSLKSLTMPRMVDWALIALVLLVLVFAVAPHQIPTTVYKLSLLSLAGVAGYWLDRSLFPYARPDSFLAFVGDELDPFFERDADPAAPDDGPGETEGPDGVELKVGLSAMQPMLLVMALAMIRRAIIIAAAMLAVGLGA